MSNFDEIVGNVKKEVGDAIGNSKLQAEGLIQEGVGKAKEAIADVEKQAADVLEKGTPGRRSQRKSRKFGERHQKQILIEPANRPAQYKQRPLEEIQVVFLLPVCPETQSAGCF